MILEHEYKDKCCEDGRILLGLGSKWLACRASIQRHRTKVRFAICHTTTPVGPVIVDAHRDASECVDKPHARLICALRHGVALVGVDTRRNRSGVP